MAWLKRGTMAKSEREQLAQRITEAAARGNVVDRIEALEAAILLLLSTAK
jgi:hypothetical protein